MLITHFLYYTFNHKNVMLLQLTSQLTGEAKKKQHGFILKFMGERCLCLFNIFFQNNERLRRNHKIGI